MGVEQVGDILLVAFFYAGTIAIASVVDEHVDVAEPRCRLCDGIADRSFVVEIERDRRARPGKGCSNCFTLSTSRAVTTALKPASRTAVARL